MNLEEIENQIRNLNVTAKGKMVVIAETVEAFHSIHNTPKFRHIKKVKPFEEGADQNFFIFRYAIAECPNITIVVKSPKVANYVPVKNVVWKDEKKAARILTSKDISEAFNAYQPTVLYGRDIQLHDTNMSTHKLIIEIFDGRMHAVVQMNHERDNIVYLN